MKKKNILFIFLFLIGLLSGCKFGVDSGFTADIDFPEDTYSFRDNCAYVDILEVEEDYIVNKQYYEFIDTDPMFNYYKYIMVKCRVIEDFSATYEENTIIHVPFWCGEDKSNEFLDNARKYLQQLDRLVVQLFPDRDYNYETIEQNSYALVYQESCEYFIGENLMKRTYVYPCSTLGIKSGRLDLTKFYDLFGSDSDLPTAVNEVAWGIIYDGMPEEELVEHLRKIANQYNKPRNNI